MSNIKAGVVVVTKFCNSEAKAFSAYIDYIDRKEAVRTENAARYNLYQDYMGNPEKTTGLFTEYHDIQTPEDKAELKEIFRQAQNKGSLMWQTVISFDNRWLEKNGLYSVKDEVLDEERLKGITKSAVHKMLEKEGLQNAVWSAAIHYNTDNIHIHIATVEPEPMREKKMYVQYRNREVNGKTVREPISDHAGNPVMKEEYKGRFKQSSIETCKREMVNQIINERENNLKINSIIRDSIVKQKRKHPLSKDRELCQMFLNLYENMPDCNRNMWNYNNPIMSPLQTQIDSITLCYIEKYHSEEYLEFQTMISEQAEKYQEAYGGESDYAKGKMQDLFTRMGNAVLKEIRLFDKECRKNMRKGIYVREIEQVENALEEKENNLGVTRDSLEETDNLGVTRDPLEEAGDFGFTDSPLNMEDKMKTNPESENDFFLKWSGRYKQAKRFLFGKNPHYDRAIHILKQEDKAGNLLATYEMGDIYRFGRGVQIDKDMAENYYHKSLQGFIKLYNKRDEEDELEYYERGKNDKFEVNKQYLSYRIGKMYYYGLGTKQDYNEALEMFESNGSIFAQYMLGKMAYAGQGMEQDYGLAYEYFAQCVECDEKNGFPYAAYQVANMIETGKVSEDSQKVDEYYTMAFKGFMTLEKKESSDNLEYRIGCMYLDGKGVKQDEDSAEEYLKMAADSGNIFAKNKLAMYYLKKGRVEKMPEIISSLKEAVEKTENIWSMYALGNIYFSDKYDMQDMAKAISWYKRAEQEGNKYISYRLGKIYLNEESEYYNVELGIEHMKKACKDGNMIAAYQLGKLYADERLDCYDLDKAIDYFRTASENENALAAYQLGKIHADERLDRYDLDKAIDYFRTAAEKDTKYATYELGKLYYDDRYGMKNNSEAYHWFRQSEESGNIRAAYQMAKIDYSGGNYKKAVTYFQKVNDAYSHYYLGKIHLDSERKNAFYNPKKGISYLKLSADGGNSYAELALGIIYLQGKDVKQDVTRAKGWLQRSVEHGNEYAVELLKNVRSKMAGGKNSIWLGVSLTTAVSKMKKGLKSEWEKSRLRREHEQLIEQSLE